MRTHSRAAKQAVVEETSEEASWRDEVSFREKNLNMLTIGAP